MSSGKLYFTLADGTKRTFGAVGDTVYLIQQPDQSWNLQFNQEPQVPLATGFQTDTGGKQELHATGTAKIIVRYKPLTFPEVALTLSQSGDRLHWVSLLGQLWLEVWTNGGTVGHSFPATLLEADTTTAFGTA